jgi:glutamyl-tRNA synthetase
LRLKSLDSVTVTIQGAPSTSEVKLVPKHKKNAEVGNKKTTYSSTILLEQEDAESFDYEANEEVHLLWRFPSTAL